MKISQITYSRRGNINYQDMEVIEVTIVNPENPDDELKEVKEWVNNQMSDQASLRKLNQELWETRQRYQQIKAEIVKAEQLYEATQEFLVAQGLKSVSSSVRFPYSLPALPETVQAEFEDDIPI